MGFSAHVVQGSGRGKDLAVPTINVRVDEVPTDLEEGVYACRVTINGIGYPGAMHYGPRPVFKDSHSCEVHLIDSAISQVPDEITLEPIERIRPVQNFPSPEELKAQMLTDIDQIRDILGLS